MFKRATTTAIRVGRLREYCSEGESLAKIAEVFQTRELIGYKFSEDLPCFHAENIQTKTCTVQKSYIYNANGAD